MNKRYCTYPKIRPDLLRGIVRAYVAIGDRKGPMDHSKVVSVLKTTAEEFGPHALASALGFSLSHIHKVLSGERRLSKEMLRVLGLKQMAIYVPEAK